MRGKGINDTTLNLIEISFSMRPQIPKRVISLSQSYIGLIL